MSKNTSYIVIAVLLLAIVFTISSLLNNEVPSKKSPKLNIDSDFVINDLEEITAPVKDEEVEIATSSLGEEDEEIVTSVASTSINFEIIAENLTIPWDLAFLPNGNLLISERGGNLVEFDVSTSTYTEVSIDDVLHVGEGGLLGMILHPNFSENRFIYLYRTATNAGKSINSVIRYVYENSELSGRTIILDNIPGALFHNGGRMAFGPDGYLYIATGDAQNPALSQDTNSLAGKILRIDENGGIPNDNPFSNEVYSYGHRNPQGITWDSAGALWSTEHGRSGVRSGLDELNLIIKGENYGWPESQGDIVVPETVGPVIHSGPDITWAPSGATYINGKIYWGGLRGETLYEAVLTGLSVSKLNTYFVNEFGRIRTTVLGPDGYLYFMTSNRDGRGDVSEGDDKILRVDVDSL